MYLLLKQKHMLYLLHFFKRCFYFFLFQSDCLFTCMCLYIHTYIVHTNIQLWILRSQDHIVIFFCLGEEACKFDHLLFFFFLRWTKIIETTHFQETLDSWICKLTLHSTYSYGFSLKYAWPAINKISLATVSVV